MAYNFPGGSTITTTQFDVLVGGAANTIGGVGPGTTGQILQSGGNAANPAYSTATYPATATSTGTILRADGTNWSATSSTFPNTNASGDLIYGSGSNAYSNLAIATIPGQYLIFDGSNPVWFNPRKHSLMFDDFITSGVTSAYNWRQTTTGGATGINNDVDSGHPGQLQLGTGTTTTGVAFIGLSQNSAFQNIILGGGSITYIWVVKIDTLSNGTDTFSVSLGLGANTSGGTRQNGVFFYGDSNTTANWQCETVLASTANTFDSGVAISTAWTTLMCTINAGATLATFFINGSQVGTTNSDFPIVSISPLIWILKSAGTTGRTINADLFYMFQNLTSNR
jgi:hypothetical protein